MENKVELAIQECYRRLDERDQNENSQLKKTELSSLNKAGIAE